MIVKLWNQFYPDEPYPGEQPATNRIMAEMEFLRRSRPIPHRDPDEIQAAHDLIASALHGEFRKKLEEHGTSMDRLSHTQDTLCWVLGHKPPLETDKAMAWLRAKFIEWGGVTISQEAPKNIPAKDIPPC